MNFNRFISSGLLMFSLTACHEQDITTSTNVTDDALSYALGMVLGERVLKQYSDIDYDALSAGMKAQHQNRETRVNLETASQLLADYQQKGNATRNAETIAKGEAYLQNNAAVDGVNVTASGLQYAVITATDGPKPSATDSVTVHYRGTLLNGTEFDSSYSRNEPATFRLNQVIPGWTEGLQLMSEGSKFRFSIPYQLAYGERGVGSSIGPYETLIFEVALIKIN